MIITVTIKDEVIRDAIGGAGCDYWCDFRDPQHSWDRKALWLTIVETGDSKAGRKIHTLARHDFEIGVARLAEQFPHHFAQLVEKNADRKVGDLIVQLAIFGEEKYS